ncbi:SurA N-terminal domain-containing protein [Tianweitania sp.]|uniref:SurA N-terminal domain-containing protein n=1 Tax=Tianweitania sp. TaxID=2021634 RepID=UPI00289DAF9F|nr:SurA N-terminal domain-containing protein [Tianweitania sp.]
MLTFLRSAAGTWISKLLLILLVVSFVVWGVSAQLVNGTGTNNVITAGDAHVSQQDFRLAYDRQINLYSQQFGTRITREQARSFGIEDQVVAQLVAGALLDQQARTMGLGVSQDRVAALTASDQAFHGPDGQFNRQQFQNVLSQAGMRPQDYLLNREQVALRQQIVEAVSDGMTAPDAFMRAAALYRGEDRTVDYVVLPLSLVDAVEEPSAADLQTYFDQNKAEFAAPEYRKISYVRMEPADIADPNSVSEEQVQSDYEKNKARFTTPERRKIEQLVFGNEAGAQAAVEAIRNGSTFESIVSAQSKTIDDVQLGTLAKTEIADKAIADAAFGLSAGQVSDVVKGNFGPVLVRVTQITPEVVRPLAEVGDQIRRDLALSEANRILLDAHDRFEDARGGGARLAEAAQQLNLRVTTIDAVDRQGRRPDGSVVDDLPASAQMLQQAFETEVGADNPGLQTDAKGYVFFDLDAITPARDRTLDEVRDQVVENWKDEQAASRLSARAADAQKRLSDGTVTLDQIASETAQQKQTKRGLKRDADDVEFGREGVAAVFSVGQGGSKVTPAPQDGAQIVFQVTEISEPVATDAASLGEEQARRFNTGIADDLLDQLVARLQGEYSVQVNRAAIDRALAF